MKYTLEKLKRRNGSTRKVKKTIKEVIERVRPFSISAEPGEKWLAEAEGIEPSDPVRAGLRLISPLQSASMRRLQ